MRPGSACRHFVTTNAWPRRAPAARAWCESTVTPGHWRRAPPGWPTACTWRPTRRISRPAGVRCCTCSCGTIRPAPFSASRTSRSTARSTSISSAARRRLRPRIRARRISRIPISRSTCRAASTATAACGSATRSRDSSCGTCGTAASRRASCPMDRRCFESSCVSCGACVDTCPTGALEDRRSLVSTPSQWTRTVCPYCGVGCELSVGTRDGRIVAVKPVLDAPVSKGHLCVKGRYAFDFVASADRVTVPMIREATGWKRVSWNEARGFVVERLRAIVGEHGPDSVGILGSARATNEDNYVAQKFARAAVGTNNVDCCARVCHAPSAAGLKRVLGAGLATNSFDDIEAARTILRLRRQRHREPPDRRRPHQASRPPRRAPHRHRSATHRARRVCRHPSRDPAGHEHPASSTRWRTRSWRRASHDREFMARRVDGAEAFIQFIADLAPRAGRRHLWRRRRQRSGRRPGSTRPSSPAMSVHGLGLTEHVQGTDGVMALINLALLTGNLGKPGSGVNPLRGQNNVQGAAHMGCDPATLPGSTPIERGRDAFERRWGAPIPATPGLNLLEMMDAAIAGRLEGALGRRLRRAADQPERRAHHPRARRARPRHRAGPLPDRDRARVRLRVPARLLARSRRTARS